MHAREARSKLRSRLPHWTTFSRPPRVSTKMAADEGEFSGGFLQTNFQGYYECSTCHVLVPDEDYMTAVIDSFCEFVIGSFCEICLLSKAFRRPC